MTPRRFAHTMRTGRLCALLLALLLSGCTSSLRLRVLQPAAINLGPDVQTIALANRYKPPKGSKAWNIIEGLFTGEGIHEDRRAADAALNGLMNTMQGSPRFTTVRANRDLAGKGVGHFPEPLSAKQIERVTRRHKADALVTIEAFDSDSYVEYSTYTRTRTRQEGEREVEYEEVVHRASVTLNVKVGWRLYSAETGAILDEWMESETFVFEGDGGSQALARRHLPQKEAIIQDIGHRTGGRYARRIAPSYIWVTRTWFTGPKKVPAMRRGRDFMKADNFAKAREAYLEAYKTGDAKVGGRAAYNLALVAEVRGELGQALDWCDRAIAKGNKQARNYRQTLVYRRDEQMRVNRQMDEAEAE